MQVPLQVLLCVHSGNKVPQLRVGGAVVFAFWEPPDSVFLFCYLDSMLVQCSQKRMSICGI